ncbi:MAG TPA: protein kinase [Pirellulales bacterium]|nr:protein kinase [Pirellulales bacterium]
MSTWNPKANEIFLRALELSEPGEREKCLERACHGDAELRAEVDALIAAAAQAGSFLESPALAPQLTATFERPVPERLGTVIGPYKLLEQIGEGGFGIVYMAEQQQPVRRKVAVKVLKPGMDSRQVTARFEAERQALALMDHPNIARVLDAGTTELSRPYFVMELVRGISITDYCNANQFTPKERLELFVSVCQAVQHAHQKGLIHRDIKPSNVLVTEHDGTPVVKVIDFGVAKALGQQLTDKTLFTGFAQMIGTPLYMSPEQAELSSLDVDTRSDIYSLGVLLYELLTGTTPFDKERLKSAAFDEIRRIIREDEPPKPSTRLSDLGKGSKSGGHAPPAQGATTTSLTSIAAQRRTEPRKLSQLVRGELDWIVMKALEKDRNRRYETANGFAADILHYLAHEPVLACPPSALYRVRKFARRNRGAVFAAALVLVALLIGIAGTTVGLLQARAERDKVVDAQGKEWQALAAAEENLQTARDAVDRMYTRAAAEMGDKPQVEQIRRALLEDALRFYRVFLKRKGGDPAILFQAALSQRRVGEIYGFLGNITESLENHRQAAETLMSLLPYYANDATFRDELANAHFHTGYALLGLLRFDESETSMKRAIALWEPLITEFPDRPNYRESLARANLALGHAWQTNQRSKGGSYLSRGQELLTELKESFPSHEIGEGCKLDLNQALAWRYRALPHEVAALRQLEKECRGGLTAAETEADKYPSAPKYQAEVADWLWRLGNVLAALDEREELMRVRLRELDGRQRLATHHPDAPEHQRGLAWAHYELGQLLYEAGRTEEAVEHFRVALSIVGDLAEKYPDHSRPLTHLAEMLRYCPAPELRDPRRALEVSQRLKEKVGTGVLDDVALAQLDAGQYSEALQSCEQYSRAAGQTPGIAYISASAYWHVGRQAEARELAQYALRELAKQPNDLWYTPECRRRSAEMVKLMKLDVEGLKAHDPEKVLRNNMALYRGLAAERPDDAGLLKELIRLSTDLWQLLANTRRDEEADQAFDSCLELRKKLVAQFPLDHDYRYQIVDLLLRRGHSLQWTRPSQAEQPYRDAVIESEQLVNESPDSLLYRLQLTHCLRFVAWILHDLGRAKEGEAFIQRALSLAVKLLDEYPADANVKIKLAQAHRTTGLIMAASNRAGEAEEEFRKAADIIEKLVPDGSAELWELAGIHADLAWSLARDPARLADAERARLRESELVERLIAASPLDQHFWNELADCHFHLYQILSAKGQAQDAEKAFDRCLDTRKKLIHDFPGVPAHCHRLATMLIDRGGFLQWSRPRESERLLSEAISIAEKLVADFPDVSDYGTVLVNGRQRLAWVLTDVGRSQQAESLGRDAVAAAEELLVRFPMDSGVRHGFASASRALGLALVANQKLDEGERLYKQSRDTFESLLAELPGHGYCRWESAHTQHELAILLAKDAARYEEAEHAYRREIELIEEMLADNRALVEHRVQLCIRHRSWAVAMLNIARPQDAEAAFRKAVAVMERLLVDCHGHLSSTYRSVLNDSYNALADFLATTGRNDEAEAFRSRILSMDSDSVDFKAGKTVPHICPTQTLARDGGRLPQYLRP